MLTYEESAALMNDMAFRGRVKVGCLKYADYIFNEANTTPAHNTRMRWATTTVQSPDVVAAGIQPPWLWTRQYKRRARRLPTRRFNRQLRR